MVTKFGFLSFIVDGVDRTLEALKEQKWFSFRLSWWSRGHRQIGWSTEKRISQKMWTQIM